MDLGEICDDGNLTSGDGCSSDCNSDESCGNGILDPSAGEACDDGNLVNHDGCAGSCVFENWAWLAADPFPGTGSVMP